MICIAKACRKAICDTKCRFQLKMRAVATAKPPNCIAKACRKAICDTNWIKHSKKVKYVIPHS